MVLPPLPPLIPNFWNSKLEGVVVVLDGHALLREALRVALELAEERLPVGERLLVGGLEPGDGDVGDAELAAVLEDLPLVLAELRQRDVGADRRHARVLADAPEVGHVHRAEPGDLAVVVADPLDALHGLRGVLEGLGVVAEPEHLGGDAVFGGHGAFSCGRGCWKRRPILPRPPPHPQARRRAGLPARGETCRMAPVPAFRVVRKLPASINHHLQPSYRLTFVHWNATAMTITPA